MKKHILLLFLVASFSAVSAQQGITWFTMGANAGFGNSIFFNENVQSDDNVTMNYFTPAYNFGGRLGFHFTLGRGYENNLALILEAKAATFGQDYDLSDPTANPPKYNRAIEVRSTDFAIMLRYVGELGGYFEVGPKFTSIKEVSDENDKTDALFTATADDFSGNYTNLCAGFGLAVVQTDMIELNLGARVSYGFDDIWATQSRSIADDGSLTPYDSYTETHPFSAQLRVELNYYFGYFGVASCRTPGIKLFNY